MQRYDTTHEKTLQYLFRFKSRWKPSLIFRRAYNARLLALSCVLHWGVTMWSVFECVSVYLHRTYFVSRRSLDAAWRSTISRNDTDHERVYSFGTTENGLYTFVFYEPDIQLIDGNVWKSCWINPSFWLARIEMYDGLSLSNCWCNEISNEISKEIRIPKTDNCLSPS